LVEDLTEAEHRLVELLARIAYERLRDSTPSAEPDVSTADIAHEAAE
jgi:hypothetical protein